MGDTANLMARYGTRLALSGAGMSPLDTPAAPSATPASPPGVLNSIADIFRKAG